MISIDSVRLMRNIRKELSQVYSKMSQEELVKIHEKFSGIPWKQSTELVLAKPSKNKKEKPLKNVGV